jgi:hypothetical protein
VNFDLEVDGGTLAPGHSIGTTTVDGSTTLLGGSTLEIEFDADGADLLWVLGDLTLAENVTLDIVPLDETENGSYLIAAYTGTLSGVFENVADGYSLSYATPGEIYLTVGDILAGDYNDDGVVNAADYVVWRNSLASGTPLANETASLGTVDDDDYTAWRDNFGSTATEGQATGQSVPEPAAGVLAFIAIAVFTRLRRYRM